MINLIGLCGFARSGKDSFANFILDEQEHDSPPKAKALSFAYAIRMELEPFVFSKLGISTFTEDPKEKEIIRPLLVCWGSEIMRKKIDKDYWLNEVKKTVQINRKNRITSIITDVRFENELNWIKKEKGLSIFIEREGVGPKNTDELHYTLPLKEECDLTFTWPTLKNFNIKGKNLVLNFLKENNLCHLITATKN